MNNTSKVLYKEFGTKAKLLQFIPLIYSVSPHLEPFNSSTKISWQLPVSSYVNLIVYNIIGREVATIVTEQKEAGYHSIEFEVIDLPSGVYFYRLQSGNFIDTKKMILLK